MCLCMCVYIYLYIYVYVCICVYIYIYMICDSFFAGHTLTLSHRSRARAVELRSASCLGSDARDPWASMKKRERERDRDTERDIRYCTLRITVAFD